MRLDAEVEAASEFKLAQQALDEEDFEAALAHFESALRLKDNPCWYSYVGYCIAKCRGDFRNGVVFCLMALETEPDNPVHYLNLGKVYLASGNKNKALLAFQDGMERGGNIEILQMLVEFGDRNAPVFKSLPRGNPLNKFLGRILHRHKLRKRDLP
jgi:tetratricopeptide (TPR) repeat protein